jgi:hypothetical protein
MVEVDAAAAPDVLTGLHALGSPHGLSFDRGRLMILPHGVSKGSGLTEAVWRLGASLHNAVAIGDTEDDQPMLDACEIGAAVAWGSSALQRSADQVVAGRGLAAVPDYIRTSSSRIPSRRAANPTRRTISGWEFARRESRSTWRSAFATFCSQAIHDPGRPGSTGAPVDREELRRHLHARYVV